MTLRHDSCVFVRHDSCEDCFYYCSERYNVVVLFGTLKVQSFILTEVSDCGLLLCVRDMTYVYVWDMTHVYVWDMTHVYVWHATHVYVWDMTHVYVWHVTYVHTTDVTDCRACGDPLTTYIWQTWPIVPRWKYMCEIWLICMCDTWPMYIWQTWLLAEPGEDT